MKICVFTGPTIGAAEARRELDATYLPPVSEGDVYRIALEAPVAIGIIDGYFENIPSVWHKEILFAMGRGIHVFGSASMGALRAAELDAFGMEGIGAIFEAYRDGLIEDDDEVAVTHGPGEVGYPLLSEAMVNIRRTLSDACASNVISEPVRQRLEATAKSLPYKERTYGNLMAAAGCTGLPARDLDRFKAWLPGGRIDQKREDAVQMLRTMRERFKSGLEPKRVKYHFEHTIMWQKATQLASPSHRTGKA